MAELAPGGVQELRDHAGEFIAMVYANPASLITARVLSRKRVEINQGFIQARLDEAIRRRLPFCRNRSAYRVVFGESDFLPGLIVDRYGDYVALQTLTAGMDRLREHVVRVLADALQPRGIFLRNDTPVRANEGLDQQKGLIFGSTPGRVRIDSDGLAFLIDIPEGQKTGFFLDQEFNRDALRRHVSPGMEALDLFSYTGGWGLHALAAGAASAVCVDSSRAALSLLEENAKLNGMAGRVETIRDRAVDYLKKARRTWDVIILDPPAFIKSRAGVAEGKKGYVDLNRRAMGKVAADGILVTCSCSHHLDDGAFEEILASASRQSGRDIRVLERRGQGPDHPELLSMPETRYLKVYVLHVI